MFSQQCTILQNLHDKIILIYVYGMPKRWFQTEMMSDGGQMSTRNISPLSFAALEDTGWYLANYSDLEPSPLGRGASCEFLFQDCLGEGGVIPTYSDQLFCNYEKFAGCAPNHMSIAMCSLRNLTSISNDTVPAEYDYFDNTVSAGPFIVPFRTASIYANCYSYITRRSERSFWKPRTTVLPICI